MSSESSPRQFDDIRLVSFAETCELLGISKDTLKRWVAQGMFPAPIALTPASPQKFRVRDIEHHLDKRRRGRRQKREPRGIIRQRLERVRGGGDA
jgi:predicted DNA-binding transcriptional regulator AlpA